VAERLPVHAVRLVAVRASYGALTLGLVAGLWLATTALSSAGSRPTTVEEALGLSVATAELDTRRAAAVAVLTATCMRSLGLTWQSVPETPPDIPDPDLGPVAWADRWGFGVSTITARPTGAADDPNLDAMAAMPEVLRSRYRAALRGSAGRPGCQETARESVYGLRDRLLRPLRAELEALEAAVTADPGVGRAVAVWRGCVGRVADGLPLDRRSLPSALLQRFATRAANVEPGSPRLRDFQDDERRVAGVLARCEETYADTRTRIAARYETAFVARNEAALSAVGAAIRTAEAALPTLPP
jgi:hypothetical protein